MNIEEMEVMNMEKRVKQVQEQMNDYENSLALEILRELKAQSKRKDIIIFVLIGVIVSMIVGFFIYESQFEIVETEETIIQEQVDTDNSNMSGVIN